MKKSFILLINLLILFQIFSQEALKSLEEDYYDFLSLQGLTERPTLNYRTLSDSTWTLTDEAKINNHLWANNNLGTTFPLWQPKNPTSNNFTNGIKQGIFLRVYGPEWFNSYNTAAPYGQNDGVLWQGKGYNTSLTGGLRLEGYGLELTFKPQISFSQNLAFDIMPSSYDNEYGYFWGYDKNIGVDAPQRFGDKPFFSFDWGDTEIRYTWENITAGFGTQAIWLGPAKINPILHSNNAATYPKVDIGLRRQSIVLPWINWYAGDIETRLWVGKLSESNYFDNDNSNNHNLISGLSLAYAPSFIPGFTFLLNRLCLVKWDWKNLKYIWPLAENSHVGEQNAGEDQKMSFGFDWIFEPVALELYSEIGLDDYVISGVPFGYIRYPFHTLAYTLGLNKMITISKNKSIYGAFQIEINNSEMSQDFQLQWPYNFGFHHQIAQGYTNKGQWLGTGYGYGGNMQHIKFLLYYPKGKSSLTIARWNPDNNFIYSKAVNDSAQNGQLNEKFFVAWKANFIFGLDTVYYVFPNLSLSGNIIYNMIMNNQYQKTYGKIHNLNISLGLKYTF